MSKDDTRPIRTYFNKDFEKIVHDPGKFDLAWEGIKKFMGYFILTGLFVLVISQASAQRAAVKKMPASVEWQSDGLVNGVEFFHSIGNCNGEKVVFLKIRNTNSFNVKISWKEEFVSKQIEKKTEGYFGQKELTLLSGQTTEANCAITNQKELIVRPDQVNPSYKAEILDFSFSKIKVSKLQ
jgi:hypothetical protein